MQSKEHTLLRLALVVIVAKHLLETLLKGCLTLLQLPRQSRTCMHAAVSRCIERQPLLQKDLTAGPDLALYPQLAVRQRVESCPCLTGPQTAVPASPLPPAVSEKARSGVEGA